jgi:hypothetical protein
LQKGEGIYKKKSIKTKSKIMSGAAKSCITLAEIEVKTIAQNQGEGFFISFRDKSFFVRHPHLKQRTT